MNKIHQRTRQIHLAETAVNELLLANEVAEQKQVARHLRCAVQAARDYAEIKGEQHVS